MRSFALWPTPLYCGNFLFSYDKNIHCDLLSMTETAIWRYLYWNLSASRQYQSARSRLNIYFQVSILLVSSVCSRVRRVLPFQIALSFKIRFLSLSAGVTFRVPLHKAIKILCRLRETDSLFSTLYVLVFFLFATTILCGSSRLHFERFKIVFQ